MFVFLFSDSRIVNHSPFTCNWQTKFLDSEPIITRFPNNTYGTSDIKILRNSAELHPASCMCVIFHVHGLGSSRMSKQNFLPLILLTPLAELHLRLGSPLPNDGSTLKP